MEVNFNMKRIGPALIFVVIAAVLAFAGLTVVKSLTAPHPDTAPVAQNQPDFQALYNARVKYVGNNSEVSNLLNVLKINRFGVYTIALETEKEPYGLTINFSDIRISSDLLDYREKGQVDEAYYILALVENLSYVEVRFEAYTVRQTVEEANSFVKGNIKDYGKSPQKLEELRALLNPAK